jgi:hypothetical protein
MFLRDESSQIAEALPTSQRVGGDARLVVLRAGCLEFELQPRKGATWKIGLRELGAHDGFAEKNCN